MTYKNKKWYHKPKRTYKNKRKSQLKKKRTMRTKRGGSATAIVPPGTSFLAEGAKRLAKKGVDHLKKKGVDYVKKEAVDQLGKLLNPASASKPSQSGESDAQLVEKIEKMFKQSEQKKKEQEKVTALQEKEKEDALKTRDEQIKKIMEEYSHNVLASSPPPTATLSKPSDQKLVNKEVEYEETQVKKGLVAFPTGDAKYFELKLSGTHASKLRGKTVGLSYASMRGKALKKMLNRVPNPSNYYFKVTGLDSDFNDKNVYVSARHVIIKEDQAKNLGKYLQTHKGYYLVVGHYENDGTNEYLYRLPHRGYIDCEGKHVVLMTTSGDTIEYPITNDPNYRFIGLKKDDSHGELITMMDALMELKDNDNGFQAVRKKFLEELGEPPEPPSSSVKDIVRFHLLKLTKLKDGKKKLKDLYSLVNSGCDHNKAKNRLEKDMEIPSKEKRTKPVAEPSGTAAAGSSTTRASNQKKVPALGSKRKERLIRQGQRSEQPLAEQPTNSSTTIEETTL